MTRRLGSTNEVPGRPGWYFGLIVTHDDDSATFDVWQTDGGAKIEGLRASKYKLASTARLMGAELPSYTEVAQAAIDALKTDA